MDSKFEGLEDMIRKRGQDIAKNASDIKDITEQFTAYKKAEGIKQSRRATKASAAEGGAQTGASKKDQEWMEGVDQEFDNITGELKEIKH